MIESDLKNKTDGTIEISETGDANSEYMIEHTLSTHYGWHKDWLGGLDSRVFVLRYDAYKMCCNTQVLFEQLKSDLRYLLNNNQGSDRY